MRHWSAPPAKPATDDTEQRQRPGRLASAARTEQETG